METTLCLDTIKAIRNFFLSDKNPVYFIDWCLFTAIGMDKWIGSLKYVCAIDNFGGQHPRIVSSDTFPYVNKDALEKVNRLLVSNIAISQYIDRHRHNGAAGKSLFMMLDAETEQLAGQLGLEVCLPPVALRQYCDHKANTNRIAEKAGVPCVPYVLAVVNSYDQLRRIAGHLGEKLVVQRPYGNSGATTYFINSEADFIAHQEDIICGEELKIMKYINCRSTGLEACVTRHGVVVAPLTAELIGFPQLTEHQGGWCGNEMYAHAFPPEINEKAMNYTIRMGEQLCKEGYKGYFELDFLIDSDDGQFFLGEMNPRFSGISPLTNNASFVQQDLPLMLLHLLEWMDVDYELDVAALNARWSNQDTLAPLSLFYFCHVEDTVVKAPPTGIYQLYPDGSIALSRYATDFCDVNNTNEAFWLNVSGTQTRIAQGEEVGALILKQRVTNSPNQLTPQAAAWIKGVKRLFEPGE
jgi:hypothetical protein